jgi:hypothetical protein
VRFRAWHVLRGHIRSDHIHVDHDLRPNPSLCTLVLPPLRTPVWVHLHLDGPLLSRPKIGTAVLASMHRNPYGRSIHLPAQLQCLHNAIHKLPNSNTTTHYKKHQRGRIPPRLRTSQHTTMLQCSVSATGSHSMSSPCACSQETNTSTVTFVTRYSSATCLSNIQDRTSSDVTQLRPKRVATNFRTAPAQFDHCNALCSYPVTTTRSAPGLDVLEVRETLDLAQRSCCRIASHP